MEEGKGKGGEKGRGVLDLPSKYVVTLRRGFPVSGTAKSQRAINVIYSSLGTGRPAQARRKHSGNG